MNNLYIHFPFCLKKCDYCDFYSIEKGLQSAAVYKQYLEALKNDLLQWKEYFPEFDIKTVYLGGGTPSLFPVELLSELFDFIAKQVSFDPREVTIEVNPATITLEKLKQYKQLGINRISLGVQSFNEQELKMLGRIHNVQEAINSYNLIKEDEFSNVNIDLMFRIPTSASAKVGRPGQNLEKLIYSLQKVVELNPEHVSIYSLTLEKNTSLFRRVAEKKVSMPDEDTDCEMYSKIRQYLIKNGYFQYEISNFCRKTFESEHNLNYWNNGEYLGLGAAAHSQIMGERFHNVGNIEEYIKNSGNVRQKSGRIMVSEAIFLGLRRLVGVDLRSFYERYGIDLLKHYSHKIQSLKENGLIDISAGNLRLTERGIFLANQVFLEFV
ncbi:radical SAM family heme chaperone HemW [Candidatus Margulisiibacteriota bacterium]